MSETIPIRVRRTVDYRGLAECQIEGETSGVVGRTIVYGKFLIRTGSELTQCDAISNAPKFLNHFAMMDYYRVSLVKNETSVLSFIAKVIERD